MNENNNLMEINTEETQKEKEKEEKKKERKNKWKEWKEKRQEAKEERKRAKEDEERVKEQEKAMHNTSSVSQERTVTNQTIKKGMEDIPTPQEIRRKKEQRKKTIRNIMTIPEIILMILLAIFLKNRYEAYAKVAHQTLNYSADQYVYEIHRDANKIKVEKNRKIECDQPPCNMENLGGYEIKFEKNQMAALRIFMDLKFFFKNDTKSVTINDIKSEYGKRCIYSMIHNDNNFLQFKTYKGYEVIDYEQMSKFTTRGYKYEKVGETRNLYIAMGEKDKSGYAIVVNSVYKRGDDLYFYVNEQTPDSVENAFALVTHPLIQIELSETPKEIYVYNIVSGEPFTNYDAPQVEIPTPANNQGNQATGIADLIGSLRDAIKKD